LENKKKNQTEKIEFENMKNGRNFFLLFYAIYFGQFNLLLKDS